MVLSAGELSPSLTVTLFFSLVVSVVAEGEFSILDVIMMSDGFATFTVILMPLGDIPVCYSNDSSSSSSSLTCMTTEGPLEWIDSNSLSRLINREQDPVMLGNLNLSVVSVVTNGTSLSVISIATINNFQFLSGMSDSLTVQCKETSTDITKQSTFIKAGKGERVRVLYELLWLLGQGH